MKRYRNKLMYLIITIFIFSFIYSFINPVNFYGMNKIQDQIKDDLIEDKARESFYVETKKEKVERDVEKIVEEEGKRIKEQSFTQKYLDCLYFSIITSCLLGYGDIYPITNISKILVSIQALVTLSLILY